MGGYTVHTFQLCLHVRRLGAEPVAMPQPFLPPCIHLISILAVTH